MQKITARQSTDLQKAKKARDAGRAARRKFISDPQGVSKIVLNTTIAKDVFVGTFERCGKALIEICIVLPKRMIYANVTKDISGATDKILSTAMAELRAESARITKVAEDNGFKIERPVYSKPISIEAKITSPKSGAHLRMIIELDNLIGSYHSAWFAGFISDVEKIELETKYGRIVRGVASAIEHLAVQEASLFDKSQRSNTPAASSSAVIASNSAPVAGTKPKPAEKTKLAKLAALGASIQPVSAQAAEAAAVS